MAAASATKPTVSKVSSTKCFGGTQATFVHASAACSCDMTFAVFVPASEQKVPVLYWLSGLTCTHENFAIKAGAQRYAAEHSVAIVMPDTSPRGDAVPDDKDGAWDFGKGAGFYLDATEAPFATHYNMETYIMKELPAAVEAAVGDSVDTSRASVFGHSMGGHGALTLFLRHPGTFRSVSAFAPICNPCECPWGHKAFSSYLGGSPDSTPQEWKDHDASHLAARYKGSPTEILVHQGSADAFYSAGQLRPEALVSAAAGSDLTVTLRLEDGYDHGYFFIATFVGQHIAFHAKALA